MHSKDKNIYKIENVAISLNTLKLDKEWKEILNKYTNILWKLNL